jgi:hypothetical protein
MPELIPDAPIPAGARVIEPEDAIAAILAGDHADAGQRDPFLDLLLTYGILAGEVITLRLANGQLAFTRREV